MSKKTYLKLPTSKIVKVRNLFKQGYSKRAINRMTNISYHHVHNIILSISPTIDLKAKAVEMYVSGEKLVYIASKLGVSKSSVHNYVKSYKGVETGVLITKISSI